LQLEWVAAELDAKKPIFEGYQSGIKAKGVNWLLFRLLGGESLMGF